MKSTPQDIKTKQGVDKVMQKILKKFQRKIKNWENFQIKKRDNPQRNPKKTGKSSNIFLSESNSGARKLKRKREEKCTGSEDEEQKSKKKGKTLMVSPL